MPIKILGGHRRITIMGLGLFGGGLGAARFWCELGSEVTVTDTRTADILAPAVDQLHGYNVRLVLGEHREEDFKNADLIVVNPAVKPDNKYVRLARATGAEVTTEVGLVIRLTKGDILGVTGSNGKSTTTSLLGAMIQENNADALVGGNLGGSLLPAMKTHLPSAPIVLELSSFQLHYLKRQTLRPRIAIVTNLTPNHLDWHKTELSYYEDKRNLLRSQSETDWAVLNVEDETLRGWSADTPGRVMHVSRSDPGTDNACYLHDGEMHIRIDGDVTPFASITSLQLPGEHNVLNALQAAAGAYLYHHDPSAIRRGLESFHGLPHRLQDVGSVDGIRFVNDSIATTPESAIRALESYPAPKVLIAGGYDKGIPFDALAVAILKYAEAVVLIGSTADLIRNAVERAMRAMDSECGAGDTSVETDSQPLLIDAGNDFDTAVKVAKEICPEGGIVLLSPACASYDMFKNFQQRGEVFSELVRRMGSANRG